MEILTIKEKNCLREISPHYKKNLNLISVHDNNTIEHELAKCKVCIYLKKQSRKFLTECKFENNCRADVFDITKGLCYEIVHSESLKSIELKRNIYPYPIISLNSKSIIDCPEESLYKYLD